jgi:hypothetical protein
MNTHTYNVSAERFYIPGETTSVMVGEIAWNYHRSGCNCDGDAANRQVDILYRMFYVRNARMQKVIL